MYNIIKRMFRKKMKIGCLFGSGISLKAGYKGFSDITDIILSGEGISHHTDSEYYFLPPTYSHLGINEDDNVNRITNFLKLIYNENKQYNKEFNNNFSPNYEDLYYIVRQLHDEIYGEQENLIVRKYIQSLEINSDSMLTAKNQGFYHNFTFNDLINEIMTYINNVVTNLLYKPKDDISYLAILTELLVNGDIEYIEIFSLNHDLLIETYFEQKKILFCDGFGSPKGDIKHFDLELFDKKNNINLYKLHGSSNWYRYRYNNTDWRGEFIGKPIIDDINYTKDENGNYLRYLVNTSMILIGTFNKLIDYNSGIFSELFCLFSNKLDQLNILLISGYGFGDVGINTKIIEWYYNDSQNKIILIHKNHDKLKEKARGAISNKWDNWIQEKRLIIINKWFEEVTFEEISKLL